MTEITQNNNTKFKLWVLLGYTILIAAICILSSVVFVQCNNKEKHNVEVVHKTDTIVKRKVDSVFVDHYYRLPGRIDTVFVFNDSDSLLIRGYSKDTIYIEKFEMRVITRDTIIKDTIMIKTTVDKQIKHFGFGFTAGFAGTYGVVNKKFDVGPSVGVGIIYKF
jgi:hypothetical protein